MSTLNESLRKEFLELIESADFTEKIKDLDKKILIEAFETMLQGKGKLEFSDTLLDNTKNALIQNLRTNLINNL